MSMYEMQRKAEETEDTSKLNAIYDHGQWIFKKGTRHINGKGKIF